MKTDTVFKRAFNDALDLVSKLGDGEPLPSENALSAQLGVSRTTVRKVLSTLAARGRRAPEAGVNASSVRPAQAMQRFPEAETVPMAAQVEKRFMEWMLRDNARPGTAINELELARQFGVATTGIREFLNRFQRFGLIEKRPNAGWVFKGFTASFALELFEIREMFELRSAIGLRGAARKFAALAADRGAARGASRAAEGNRATAITTFPISTAGSTASSTRRRPIGSSTTSTTSSRLIFHYHYQWNKHDERQAQRGRDPGASHLHRSAAQPQCRHRRTRVPGASGLGEGNLDERVVGKEPGRSGKWEIRGGAGHLGFSSASSRTEWDRHFAFH